MYFNLRLDDAPQPRVKVIFHQYEDEFKLSGNIVFDKFGQFQELFGTKRGLVAEISAAIVCGLFRADYLDKRKFVKEQLELCSQTITDIGFSVVSESTLLDTLEENVAVLVPGCQNKPMIDRRVDCLFHFNTLLQRPFSIVFSGKNPGREPVRIKNESEYMKARFDELNQVQQQKKYDIKIRLMDTEELSRTTNENIREFFGNEEYLNRKQVYSVVIISSTFHLMRIAELIVDHIKTDSFGIRSFVGNVVLIGAESSLLSSGELGYWDNRYIKSMMYDLYNKHLS